MLDIPVQHSLKESWQWNVAEQVEFIMMAKEDQFRQFIAIIDHLTSDSHWQGTITEYEEGYYLSIEGCRSTFRGFIDPNCQIIRKPNDNKLHLVEKYEIEGRNTEIYRIWRTNCRK